MRSQISIKQLYQDLKTQWRSSYKILFGVYLITFITFLLIPVLAKYLQIELSVFTRDPISTLKSHPYAHPLTGIISNLGALLWMSSVTICFFGANILKNKLRSSFFLSAGLISLVLLLDDFFMLHDFIFPLYFSAGKFLLVFFYLIIVPSFVLYFRQVILTTEYFILFLAACFLGLSITIDIKIPLDYEKLVGHYRILLEDGFKFLGIITWLIYCSRTLRLSLQTKEKRS